MSNRFYTDDKVIVDHTRCVHRPALVNAVVKFCNPVANDYIVTGMHKDKITGKMISGEAHYTFDELTPIKENK